MLLLAFDTAGPNCAVAVAGDGGSTPAILASATERIGRGHAEALMPMIEATLGECRRSFEDLDRIAVTTGPGSFTGVRVGIAAARALALALAIPAVGVGNLAALAFDIRRTASTGTAVAALDAKRGELNVQVEDIASGAVLQPAAALFVEEIAAMLASVPRPVVLSGAGAARLAAALADPDARIVGTSEAPDVATVALLGLRAAAAPPSPLYTRGADAKPQAGMAVARR